MQQSLILSAVSDDVANQPFFLETPSLLAFQMFCSFSLVFSCPSFHCRLFLLFQGLVLNLVLSVLFVTQVRAHLASDWPGSSVAPTSP